MFLDDTNEENNLRTLPCANFHNRTLQQTHQLTGINHFGPIQKSIFQIGGLLLNGKDFTLY